MLRQAVCMAGRTLTCWCIAEQSDARPVALQAVNTSVHMLQALRRCCCQQSLGLYADSKLIDKCTMHGFACTSLFCNGCCKAFDDCTSMLGRPRVSSRLRLSVLGY